MMNLFPNMLWISYLYGLLSLYHENLYVNGKSHDGILNVTPLSVISSLYLSKAYFLRATQ